MKKKLILTVLSLVCSITCAIGLTACGIFGGDESGHTHVYGSYIYNNDATCGEDGTESAKCTKCDKIDTRTKPNTATGEHSFLSYTYNNDATCEKDGTESATCENCNEVDTRNKEGSAATGAHKYEDYICSLCKTLDPDAPYTDGLLYTPLTNDGFSIIGYGVSKGSAGENKYIKIPLQYSGLPVLSIQDEAFRDCSNIEYVEIPSSVKRIGDYAFSSCGRIAYIEIPDGVTNIGRSAFYNSGLVNVSIPDSVIEVGDDAFYCASLNYKLEDDTEYLGNKENPYVVLFYSFTSQAEFVMRSDTRIIYNGAFRFCKNLSNIVMSDNLTYIGSQAFSSCEKLTQIKIPDNVMRIGDAAFSGCSKISSVVLPSKLKTIGSNVFRSNSKLRDITIPNSVTSIGAEAFYNCKNLVSLTIPSSVTEIGKDAFNECRSLTLYCEVKEQPDGWKDSSAGPDIVWDCKNNDKDKFGYAYTFINGLRYMLKDGEAAVAKQPTDINSSISVPSYVTYKSTSYTVTSIGSGAFSRATDLRSISLPNTLTDIDEYAFYYCSNLRSITIPNKVTRIARFAFNYCNSLTTVTIPSSVKTIETMAFAYCDNLTTVIIPLGVTSIDFKAFCSCPKLTLYCAESSRPSGWSSDWYEKCNVEWGYRG